MGSGHFKGQKIGPYRKRGMSEVRQERLDAVLGVIERSVRNYGWPPTISEIGSELHLSKTMVYLYLGHLEASGRIERFEGMARGIRILGEQRSAG